ncbi:hypothetical protein [Endozoicomonas sp. 2B-B]
MKLVHALFLMFPYWGFGDSAVAVFAPNQTCLCYQDDYPYRDAEIDFEFAIQKKFLWYNCSNPESDDLNCSGVIANDSSCHVSISGRGMFGETLFSINCNNNSCVTILTRLETYYQCKTPKGCFPLVCQTPKGCFPLVNDGTCVLPKAFKKEDYINLYYDFYDWKID